MMIVSKQMYMAKPSSVLNLQSSKRITVTIVGNQPPLPSIAYSGPASSFPPQFRWLSFGSLWEINKPVYELNSPGTSEVTHKAIYKLQLSAVLTLA